MQALILAAGMGNRLRPLSKNTPKALIEVNGVPAIFNTLNILSNCGIKKTTIVTGYLSEVVKEKVGDGWKGMEINYVENKEYEETNNIYSVWLARDVLNEDTILMECDIFFEEELIKRLLAENLEDKVVVDFFQPNMDGTVVEIGSNKEIKRLITAEDQDINFDYSNKYKTVNVYLFTKEFLANYFLPNLDLYIKTQGKSKYYELILSIFINLHNPVLKATIADDIKWIEIDDFSDLRMAEILFSDQKTKLEKIKTIHGGYWRYDFKDFSYLYNLYFPPASFINEIKLNIDKLIGNYPSCQEEIDRSLANWLGIDANYLTVANGSSEIIKVINQHLIKKIAIPVPTFNEYENTLRKEQIVYFLMKDNNFSLNIDAYINTIKKEGCSAALIINPNNPTAQFIPLKDIQYFLDELRELKYVIIDESFLDFVAANHNQSLEQIFEQYPNLILIRSMGKEFSLPGVRLGYAVSANKKFNNLLREHLPIWNINSIAEYVVEILPKYRKEYQDSLAKVISDRDYLYQKLFALPYLEPLPSSANFVFAKLKDGVKSDELTNKLFENYNILIKDCSNKTGLEDKKYIRIAARTKEETDLLIDCLNKVVKL